MSQQKIQVHKMQVYASVSSLMNLYFKGFLRGPLFLRHAQSVGQFAGTKVIAFFGSHEKIPRVRF